MNENTEQKTKHYGQDKETDRAVEALIQREVLACQSSLVDALLETEPHAEANAILCDFRHDEIENLYPDPSKWSAARCKEWIEDESVWLEEYARREDEGDHHYRSRLHIVVREDANCAEIFEWWLITTWAADKLREQNEPILEVGNDIWWGRTCTGQSIALDPTWYDIYATIK